MDELPEHRACRQRTVPESLALFFRHMKQLAVVIGTPADEDHIPRWSRAGREKEIDGCP